MIRRGHERRKRSRKSRSFLFIDPRCHPRASIQADYNQADRWLRIECLACGREVLTIKTRENDSQGLQRG